MRLRLVEHSSDGDAGPLPPVERSLLCPAELRHDLVVLARGDFDDLGRWCRMSAARTLPVPTSIARKSSPVMLRPPSMRQVRRTVRVAARPRAIGSKRGPVDRACIRRGFAASFRNVQCADRQEVLPQPHADEGQRRSTECRAC